MKKRIVPPNVDSPVNRNVKLSGLINFGPITAQEFEAMGLTTLEQLDQLGWEDACRKWVEHFPERLNVNAFIGIIATLDGIAWTKVDAQQKAAARNLINKIRGELSLPPKKFTKKSRR